MLVYLLLTIGVICLLLAALPFVVRRDRRLDEVERFHLARAMTTEWARHGTPQPRFADDAAIEAAEAGDHSR